MYVGQSWNRVTDHRVTGSMIMSGSGRVSVIYLGLQTRYCDAVARTHCTKSRLNERAPLTQSGANCLTVPPCPSAVSVQVARPCTYLQRCRLQPLPAPHRLIFKSSFKQTFTTADAATWDRDGQL